MNLSFWNHKRKLKENLLDRGKARYFHGRRKEIDKFKSLMWETKKNQSGTSFLVQGSPGVGKTALLEELKTVVDKKKWRVCHIPMRALWDVDELYRWVSNKSSYRSTDSFARFDVHIVKAGVKKTKTVHPSLLKVIKKIKKKPTLIVLDEAQRLGYNRVISEDNERDFLDVFDYLHNLKTKKGFIFLIGGLGMTEDIFDRLGVASRFNEDCVINLPALDKTAERAILKNWIINEGGSKESNPKVHFWIDEIVKETHGWPLHINCYAKSAANYLQKNNVAMTNDGLKKVLREGRNKKIKYYEKRLKSFDDKEVDSIAKFLQQNQNQESFSKDTILEFFRRYYPFEKSMNIYFRLVEKGVFHRNSDRKYIIPVPSMRKWLMKLHEGD
ncbi:MAG: ATP-binding protein [Flavobacteriaceae bacterium]|nr:ATP-binding protein [Flavobacteriaceae bacterium]MCY4298749.1 ATP-binding protein [Flavobacteriaceae bacterium]